MLGELFDWFKYEINGSELLFWIHSESSENVCFKLFFLWEEFELEIEIILCKIIFLFNMFEIMNNN